MLKIYDYGNIHKSDAYSRLYFQDSELDIAKKMVENFWTNFYESDEDVFDADWYEFFWKTVKTKKGIKYRFYSKRRYHDKERDSYPQAWCKETILVLPNA